MSAARDLADLAVLQPALAEIAADGGWPTGSIRDTLRPAPAAGWLFLDGRSIGDAGSGADARAHADTAALYALLWDNCGDSLCPVDGGRGESAAADFAAGKPLTLPSARGRARFGRDDMGGSAAGLLTEAGGGLDGTVLGAAGGAQNRSIAETHLPAHSHGAGTLATDSAGNHTHSVPAGNSSGDPAALSGESPSGGLSTGAAGAHTHAMSGSTGATGGGTALPTLPPALIVNVEVKL
ncbi:MAG: hypothetical protein AB7G39_12680 [Alphaproteobacteria bacterium]